MTFSLRKKKVRWFNLQFISIKTVLIYDTINYAIILDQSYAKMFSLYETLIYSETEYNCNNSFSFVPTRIPNI